MKPFDVFLAVLVAVIWGLGFVASRLALDELSPALMTAMRFAIAAAPCLLVRRPKVPWTVLIAISGTLFLGQFLAQCGRSRTAFRSGLPASSFRARRYSRWRSPQRRFAKFQRACKLPGSASRRSAYR
jgi:hypothetical protein